MGTWGWAGSVGTLGRAVINPIPEVPCLTARTISSMVWALGCRGCTAGERQKGCE